jgi:hypothetical protein
MPRPERFIEDVSWDDAELAAHRGSRSGARGGVGTDLGSLCGRQGANDP